ncbi:MAG TPA: AraC family transcriptional regulator [Puia sp.]|nr:AraC family transcriptional regulator [Puia sp.]
MINTYDFAVKDPAYFKQLSVKDLLFLYYKCPQVEKKMDFYAHYNMLVYTLSGKKRLSHQGRSFYMTDNTSLLVRKTAYNSERFYEADWEVIAFYMPDDFLAKTFHEFQLANKAATVSSKPQEMLLEVNIDESTKAFFYGTLPLFSQTPAPPESLLELKFRELIFHILSNPLNENFRSYLGSLKESQKISLQEVMEANFNFNLTLDEYARLCHRSLASFKRDFEKVFHTTPGKWIIGKRLEYARGLLQHSRGTITEIAAESGFENLPHFIKVFKEKFHTTPLQYKKRQAVN